MAFGIFLAGLALIAVLSWAIASPFFGRRRGQVEAPETPEDPWEARRKEALDSIRDTELDYHIGKLSEADYREMRRRLEAEAVEAIHHTREAGNARRGEPANPEEPKQEDVRDPDDR